VRILFISTWFPYPLDTGSRIRVYHLLRALVERHEIHLLAFMPAEAAHHLPELRTWCPQVTVVERDPFWRDPRKALLGYFSLLPRDVVASYSNEMARLVAQATEGQSYDLVVASVVNAAPYALLARGTPRVLEEHNFMTVGWKSCTGRSPARPEGAAVAYLAKVPALRAGAVSPVRRLHHGLGAGLPCGAGGHPRVRWPAGNDPEWRGSRLGGAGPGRAQSR